MKSIQKRILGVIVLAALAVGLLCGCSSSKPGSGSPVVPIESPEKFMMKESISLLKEMWQVYADYPEQLSAITDPLSSGQADKDFFKMNFESPDMAIFLKIDHQLTSLCLGQGEQIDFSSAFLDEFMAEIPGQFVGYVIPALLREGDYSNQDVAKINLVSWLSKSKSRSAPSEFSNYILFLGYGNSVVITSFIRDDSQVIRYRCNYLIPGLSARKFFRQYAAVCQDTLGVDIVPYTRDWTDLSVLIR